MKYSIEPYRTKSGRVAYRRMNADLATKLRLRELDVEHWRNAYEACVAWSMRGTHELQEVQAELASIPKPVRVVCRIVGRLLRGRDAGCAVPHYPACTSQEQGKSVGQRT